jgi:hypothetical protein
MGELVRTGPPKDLPEPSAELILKACWIAAVCAEWSERKRCRVFARMERNLLLSRDMPALRAPAEIAEAMLEREKALGWWRVALPLIRAMCDG